MLGNMITLDDIRFSYSGTVALAGVKLRLGRGIHGLLGPNGAGKTTLMKVILGFLRPASGSGTVLGHPLKAGLREARRHVGYMPESDCLLPGLDAVEFTAYLGELSGMPRRAAIKRAHDVLYYVGLEESRYRMVETYSTGMRQRLKLAQALVHDPSLLLLDEPTSGMDPAGRQTMLDLIREIASAEGKNVILSTHLLPDVEATCNDVVIVDNGRVVAVKTVRELQPAAGDVFDVRIKGEPAGFGRELEALSVRVTESEKGRFRVELPPGATTRALFQAARKSGAQVRHLQRSRVTLEEAFIRAVEENHGNPS